MDELAAHPLTAQSPVALLSSDDSLDARLRAAEHGAVLAQNHARSEPGRGESAADTRHAAARDQVRLATPRSGGAYTTITASTLDTVEEAWGPFRLSEPDYDAMTVSGELIIDDRSQEPYSEGLYNPVDFPALFVRT